MNYYTNMRLMHTLDDPSPILASINEYLAESNDPGRIGFYQVNADPYLDDEWVVVAQWVLPDPEEGEEIWPIETIRRYDRLLWDRFRGVPYAIPLSRFCTAAEVEAADRRLGRPLEDVA